MHWESIGIRRRDADGTPPDGGDANTPDLCPVRAKLKPCKGDRNLAVGEVNAEGVNETHGKAGKHTEPR